MSEPISRRSIHDKLQERSDPDATLVDSSFSLLNLSELTDSFVFDQSGRLVSDVAAPLPVEVSRTEALGKLPPLGEQAHHLLVLPANVQPAQLEALAVNIWDSAGWTTPGKLHLVAGAYLEGPWELTGKRRLKIDLPDDYELAWELHYPATRGQAPSPELAQNKWARAFPDGMPTGTEMLVLDALWRIAKRLGGALRIAGSGEIMVPDPDESVNLRLYSPEYLPMEVAWETLLPLFSPPAFEEGQLEVQIPPTVDDVEKPPYALFGDDGAGTRIMVAMHPEEVVPRALRWEPWTKQPFFCYDLQWVMTPELHELLTQSTRAGRSKRWLAAGKIEEACVALAQHLHSRSVIDEDGFLVAVEAVKAENVEAGAATEAAAESAGAGTWDNSSASEGNGAATWNDSSTSASHKAITWTNGGIVEEIGVAAWDGGAGGRNGSAGGAGGTGSASRGPIFRPVTAESVAAEN